MRVDRRSLRSFAGAVTLLLVSAALVLGQASYTAQVRGVVKDQSGAMIPGATVTITNDATGIAGTAHSDDHGFYILTGLRPAVYTIRTEAAGFRVAEQKNVVLQVDQQTSIDFELHPLGVITTVEVTQAAPVAGHGKRLHRHGYHQRVCARYSFVQPEPVRTGVSGGRSDGDYRIRHHGQLPIRNQLRLQRAAQCNGRGEPGRQSAKRAGAR